MHIDIARQLGATSRVLRAADRDGRPTWVVVAERTYDTDIADLWAALTEADRIARWFLPISGDLRLGGRFQLEGNAGGEILTCAPPRGLAVTWELHGDVSWVQVALESVDGGRTRLRLEHTAHPPEALWSLYGPGAVGVGWELALLGLALVAGGGGCADRDTVLQWTQSAEGLAFIRAVSAGWGQADAAAGTPGMLAQARADATAAFYTGQEG